ncbi:uncharacterized protein LOC116247532 [Nymphaea colorata]|nr:uncharacterized protein LOC116247532 [Nymphaea colorata]
MIVLEAEILASRFDYCPSLRAVSKDKGKRETGPLLIFPLLSELIRRAKPGEDDAGYPASLSILVHLSHSSASERDRDLDRHGGVHEGGTSDRSCRLPHDRAAPQAHCASPLGVPSPHISVWVGRLGSVVFLPCEILPSKKHRVESPGCSGRRDFAKAGQVVVNYNTRVLQNDIRTHVDIGAGANLYLIFYTLFSAIVGFLLGASDGLGEDYIQRDKAYAAKFAPFWNEIVKTLREEDYITNLYLLQRSALELFMIDQSNFFFDFGTAEGRRNTYGAIVQARPPHLNNIYLTTQTRTAAQANSAYGALV